MYTSNKLVTGVIHTNPSDNNTRGHTFPQIWIGCLAVIDDKVFICLYDMLEVVCSALLVPTTCEVTNDKQCQFAHTFSQDLD
jgi:hypothetical protein